MQPIAQSAIGIFDTSRHEGLLRARLSPLDQAIRDAVRKGGQRLLGHQIVHARPAIAQLDARHAKGHRSVFDAHVGLLTLCFLYGDQVRLF
jgi:hypothetical protein